MKFIAFLPLIFIFSCNGTKHDNNKEINTRDIIDSSKMAVNVKKDTTMNSSDLFFGEYLIGDSGGFIVPVKVFFEIRNEKGEKVDVIYFIGKEKDTISLYANKGKSIIFKMNPGHKSGMYYKPDEKWPVTYVGPIRKDETEGEESESIFKQRHIEDSITYTQLNMYDGTYLINTESEGVNAKLTLHYNGDRTFNYKWSFEVSNEEANCKAKRKGTLIMDRTQHGFDRDGPCMIHFNFNGYWSKGYVVEMDFENQSSCQNLKGDCIFSGTYTTE